MLVDTHFYAFFDLNSPQTPLQNPTLLHKPYTHTQHLPYTHTQHLYRAWPRCALQSKWSWWSPPRTRWSCSGCRRKWSSTSRRVKVWVQFYYAQKVFQIHSICTSLSDTYITNLTFINLIIWNFFVCFSDSPYFLRGDVKKVIVLGRSGTENDEIRG